MTRGITTGTVTQYYTVAGYELTWMKLLYSYEVKSYNEFGLIQYFKLIRDNITGFLVQRRAVKRVCLVNKHNSMTCVGK